jgi:hypothetical protein
VVLSLFMKLPVMETSVGLCCIPLKSHALAVTYDMKLALRGDLMLLSCIHGDSYGMRRRVRGIWVPSEHRFCSIFRTKKTAMILLIMLCLWMILSILIVTKRIK